MVGLIEKYQFMFEKLSWYNNKLLNWSPDPDQTQSTLASFSRATSLDRRFRQNYYHTRPLDLSSDASVSELERWQSRFQIWIVEQVGPHAPDNEPNYLFESIYRCSIMNGQAPFVIAKN